MLKSYQFGPEALQYIEAQLREGNQLSQYVLEYCPLEEGSTWAFLPDGVSPDALSRFNTGGIANTKETQAAIVENTVEYLKKTRAAAVFEDMMSLPADPALLGSGLDFVVCGPQVYLSLIYPNLDLDSFSHALRFATSYTLLGVISDVTSDLAPLPRGARVQASLLQKVAARAVRLLVGAYDGESVLIWARR